MTNPSGVEIRAAARAQVIADDLETLEIHDTDSHHLFRVLRLREGETVIAADGHGRWRTTVVTGGHLEPSGELVTEERARPEVAVAFAPVKGDRSEWAVAKLTEVGCDRIVALTTQRAAVRWNERSATKALERWRRVAREASCQSRRVWLPSVEGPSDLPGLANRGGVALAVPGGSPMTRECHTIAVGPEGGWADAERGHGLLEISLAKHVLRTETAAVAAGVLLEACRQGTVATLASVEERGANREECA